LHPLNGYVTNKIHLNFSHQNKTTFRITNIKESCLKGTCIVNVYTSDTVKYLKNFFKEVKNYYEEENAGKDIELSKILLNCAIDRKMPALLRAVSFLYLAELPPDIEEKIPNLLTDLENSFKENPRPEEDNLSVGAVQVYDYNQACLNRHYARRSQESDSSDILNLREFERISYAKID
jgi:hypothetical protein